VAAVATAIHHADGNITEAQQFDDPASGQFFMRVEFSVVAAATARAALESQLVPVTRSLNAAWTLREANALRRVLILVSKQDHCLADLLYRTRIGELRMNIVGIISNHPLPSLAAIGAGDIPFHQLPVCRETRSQQEVQIRSTIERTDAELVVLARYMQILSPEFAQSLVGRCINIHHSFLPGFKGAKPYHQAHERGVKVIGATAHYVTGDLDEGPIIEQDIVHVSHADSPEALSRKGRDVERQVLSRAVNYHLQDRVLLNGHRTVVFRP
jgi:formyltetrahydrofolate deformylase